MIKTILILASFPFSLVNFRFELIKTFIEKDYIVHVAAPHLKNEFSVLIKLESLGVICHNVSIRRDSSNPFSELYSLFSILFLIYKIKPNIFMGYTIKPVIWGAIAAKILKIDKCFVIITGLGYVFTRNTNKRIKIIRHITCFLYKLALKFTTAIFFQNDDDVKLFSKLKLLPKGKKVLVINGSGINLNYFTKSSLPKTPLKFLLIARMLGNKGIREFAKAAEKIKKNNINVVFELVGGVEVGSDAIPLDEIKDWENKRILNWIGKVDDVRSYLTLCHVFVLPSYREGTPRTVLEAMATGRPIITTNVPGCRHLIEKNKNGILIPPKSVKSLIDAMKLFIDKKVNLENMGNISYEFVKEQFDVYKVNKKIIEEIEK